jgi:phosphoribosylanthranilate isomerase
MFRVKICGITNVEDATCAVDAGADAIGLNFYEKSPRCVSVDRAREICLAIAGRALAVGVFVNASRETIDNVRLQAGLDAIQLHGDEPPEDVAHFSERLRVQLSDDEERALRLIAETAGDDYQRTMQRGRPSLVIRARRLDDRGVAAIARDLAECSRSGPGPGAVLVDSATPGRYGGTGETVSWVGLNDHRRWLGDVPLILAGGLTAANVAEAIRIVQPAGVDVASGVESEPGKKDPDKVSAFVELAVSAFPRQQRQ